MMLSLSGMKVRGESLKNERNKRIYLIGTSATGYNDAQQGYLHRLFVFDCLE